METTRLILLLSTIAFLAALVHAVFAIRAGQWRESRWHLIPMAVGFALQSAFLYLRGQQHGRCPLTNLFEVFIFIGWSIMLLYFLVGTAYRLSLLGVFTAPLIAVLQIAALLSPLDQPVRGSGKGADLHAAVGLIGYAAFALACITGIMYLLQDRLLKRHHINALFHQLPPIHALSKAITRMVLLGVIFLGFALAASLEVKTANPHAQLLVFSAWGGWVIYIVTLLLMWRHRLSARLTALLAIGGFAVVFFSIFFIWVVAK